MTHQNEIEPVGKDASTKGKTNNQTSANNFFIILDNLYDLLWSTSRP